MTLLSLDSDRMGSGDDELGRRPLASVLEKSAAAEVHVDLVGCVNGAVALTTEGSRVPDSLRILEARGARIATCGTCFDHHGLKARLAIGVVGGMPQTVEPFATADRVIAPC